jgi:hypothetical protein
MDYNDKYIKYKNKNVRLKYINFGGKYKYNSKTTYIIHGTFRKNTLSILHDGYLNTSKENNQKILEKSINQIFTQMIYTGMPYESNQKPYWWDDCFILSTNILKDKKFYGNIGLGHCDKFEDCMDDNNTLKTDIKGKGKLKKNPNLTKFKTKLNRHLKNKLGPGMDIIGFMHSHEILFKNKINLKKYCVGLVLYSKKHVNYKEITKIANKLNIKVFILKEFGINNFMNLIKN